MKERPLIVTTEMIPKVLDGTKTQTRRVIKPQPEWRERRPNSLSSAGWFYQRGSSVMSNWPRDNEFASKFIEMFPCPYGQVGSKLWVRECFCEHTTGGVLYRADEKPTDGVYAYHKWQPSIHMPRWASRITLEITGIRVERLQEITLEDAIAEGCVPCIEDTGIETFFHPARGLFKDLWNSLNAKRGYPWESNPFVWVIGIVLFWGIGD